jgi:hypothetical protein
LAGLGAVFDVVEVAEEVLAVVLVVAGAAATGGREVGGHAEGATAADVEEEGLFGGDATKA